MRCGLKMSVCQSRLAADLLEARSNAESDVDENRLDVLLIDLAEDLGEAAHCLQGYHVIHVVFVIHAGHHRRQNHRTELLYLPHTTADKHHQHSIIYSSRASPRPYFNTSFMDSLPYPRIGSGELYGNGDSGKPAIMETNVVVYHGNVDGQ